VNTSKKESGSLAFLIIMPTMKTDAWVRRLRSLDASLDIRTWPDAGAPEEIEFVLAWKPPPGAFNAYPNLRCIASMGAGVDHLFRDPGLPAGVPITRIVEPSMGQSMSEYVIMTILNHCRQTDHYRKSQEQSAWKPKIPLRCEKERVGILGLGQLGSDLAGKLSALGFPVAGWRRDSCPLEGVNTYWGENQLGSFLASVRILVCLLPLTAQTRGILNRDLFGRLPEGAYLINVARGEHLVETDLIEALDRGRLSGACLDVFAEEPLPAGHRFWAHPKIVVTPHISSLTNPRAVVPQIYENYRRAIAGEPLLHRVDPERQY
jgi:glyoxylate/hydroxypyruvate reductase